jgi:serine/threonine-protein kinase RsbW
MPAQQVNSGTVIDMIQPDSHVCGDAVCGVTGFALEPMARTDMETAMSDPWLWRYDRVIVSDPTLARQVLDEMLAQLEARQWQQRDIFAVHLAAEEALVNAIHHGNGCDATKSVHVVCLLSDDRIRIEITDEGRGFDPAKLPDPTCGDHLHAPCGRGVMLMRAFMSRVEFNASGNGVIMEKQRGLSEEG